MNEYKCECGKVITKDDCNYWNGTDEEGAETSSYEFNCAGCGKVFEFSEWGACESMEDAIEIIHFSLNDKQT